MLSIHVTYLACARLGIFIQVRTVHAGALRRAIATAVVGPVHRQVTGVTVGLRMGSRRYLLPISELSKDMMWRFKVNLKS